MAEGSCQSFEEAMALAEQLTAREELDEALELLVKLLAEYPDNPAVLHGLGVVISRKGDIEQALPVWLAALQKGRSPRVLSDVLAGLTSLERYQDVVNVAEAFQDILLDDAGQLSCRGAALLLVGRHKEAIHLLNRALELSPGNVAILHNLSIAQVLSGDMEDSVATYARMTVPWNGEVAANGVVQEYLSLAPSYDSNELHQAFARTLLAFAQCALPEHRPVRVLELGCGTGLMGELLPASVQLLVGVDLSPDMLVLAAARNRYHRLLQGDMVAVMSGLSEGFDAIFSAAVLYHIADLRPVFNQAARLLEPGGAFVFSVDPSPDGQDIGVSTPGEYCHSRAYLRGLAAEAGLSEASIAIDVHRPTPGFYCAFRK